MSIANRSIIDSSSFAGAEGDGGSIGVDANTLSLTDVALISAVNRVSLNNASEQSNQAGNIRVDADNIRIDNTSFIQTDTESGNGGDIGIDAGLLIMQNDAQVTTSAGQARQPGDGGNITMNTDLLVGFDRSHISANAFEGSGGQVEIEAIGEFGFEVFEREQLEDIFDGDLTNFRPTQLSVSSITAISQTNPALSGIVELNVEIDPSSGLIDLSPDVIDPNDLISQDPCRLGQDSEFYDIGRGGLPPNPRDPQSVDLTQTEPIEIRPGNNQAAVIDQPQVSDDLAEKTSADITPARGWIRNDKGEVILVSYDPTRSGLQRQLYNPNFCQPQSPSNN
ncbi:MAG: hypothetical protein ACFBSC_05855 [Microcoleaceae cyanobacterium]